MEVIDEGLLPQTLVATTLIFPPAALRLAVTAKEVVPWPELIVQPTGTVQV